MPTINLFGREYVIKQLRAERFKKAFTIATPPPWYRNPSALSKGQVSQILRFSQIAHATAGRKLKERMAVIGSQASGPTGMAQPRVKPVLPRIGRILTMAEKYGISIPAELRTARPIPVTSPAIPRIRE